MFRIYEDTYDTEQERPNFYNRNLTSREIWLKDAEKQTAIENRGFIYLNVWENAYRHNKEETLKKLFNTINTIINDAK